LTFVSLDGAVISNGMNQMRLGKVKKFYRFVSYTFLNILILAVVFNLIAYGYYKVRNPFLVRNVRQEKAQRLLKSYEGMYSLREILKITAEGFVTAKHSYESWVGFKDRPYVGQYVNVTEEGYRLNSKEQKNKSSLRIFAFGGSTMFGYGVKDEHTIPAFMEKELPSVQVVNYGRSFYYSTQEMQLFLKLLRKGNIPDVAIFLDGLNDTRNLVNKKDEPAYTPTFKKIFSQGFYIDFTRIPLFRLMRSIRLRIVRFLSNMNPPAPVAYENLPCESAEGILSRYRENVKLIKFIADTYKVKVYFFWQPVPHYAYNLKNHFFKRGEHCSGDPLYRKYNEVYTCMKENLPEDVIWMGDMFNNKKYVYVDMHHYNPEGCRMIAEKIIGVIETDMLLAEKN